MMSIERAAAERMAKIAKYDAAHLRSMADLAISKDTAELCLEAARLVESGELRPPGAAEQQLEGRKPPDAAEQQLEGRNVSPQCAIDGLIGGQVVLTQCVCGERYPDGIGINLNEPETMPCCGARLAFRQDIYVVEVVEQGKPITQPPEDHPIWSTEIQQAGPIALTLRHLRESILQEGGTFVINGYNRDGNVLIDAATPDGVTFDELVQQVEREIEQMIGP